MSDILLQELLVHDGRDVEQWVAHAHKNPLVRHWWLGMKAAKRSRMGAKRGRLPDADRREGNV